jgi:hypothetical protein
MVQRNYLIKYLRRMNSRKIVEWLIGNKFDPSLSVAKWFNSILVFSAVYFLLNVFVVSTFSFNGSMLTLLEGLLLFIGHAVILFLFLFMTLKGFVSKKSILNWLVIIILIIVCCFIQSVTLFLIVTHDVLLINLQQQLISERQVLLSEFNDKIDYLTAAMRQSNGLYLVLMASFLFNCALLAYPLFTLLQFKYSGRRFYFFQYLKIRKSIYNVE